MKHTLRNITFALLAVSLAATSATTFWLYAKVQNLQKERNSTVSSNISPAQTGTVPEGRGTVPEVVGTVPAPLTVKRFEYNGRDEIGLYLSARPDMEVVRHYVTVEPLEKGTLSFSFKTPWNWDLGRRCDKLVIRGDFAQGKILFTVKGEDTALLLCQQAAVERGKKGEIHLFPKIFLRHR